LRKLGDLFTIQGAESQPGRMRFFILDRPREAVRNTASPEILEVDSLPGSRHLRRLKRPSEGDPFQEPDARQSDFWAVIDCESRKKPPFGERFPAFWTYLEKGQGTRVFKKDTWQGRRPFPGTPRRNAARPLPFLASYMAARESPRAIPFAFS